MYSELVIKRSEKLCYFYSFDFIIYFGLFSGPLNPTWNVIFRVKFPLQVYSAVSPPQHHSSCGPLPPDSTAISACEQKAFYTCACRTAPSHGSRVTALPPGDSGAETQNTLITDSLVPPERGAGCPCHPCSLICPAAGQPQKMGPRRSI